MKEAAQQRYEVKRRKKKNTIPEKGASELCWRFRERVWLETSEQGEGWRGMGQGR